MSFLAMSTWQAVTVVALSAAAIVGLYLLKSPPLRIVVSSTLLWSRVLKSDRRRSDRLRWWLSLLLALAVAIAIALALGRPEWRGSAESQRGIAVIIDSSPSMLTLRSDGRTRWEHARDEARRLLRSGRPVGSSLIADTSRQTTLPTFEDVEQAIDRLEKLRATAHVQQALPELALGDAVLYFVTDGVMVEHGSIPAKATLVSVFEPADNVGVTRFEPRALPAEPFHYEAYVEIRNHSDTAKNVVLQVSGAGSQGVRRELELGPGQTLGEIFDLESFKRGPIRAAVTSSGDSLDIDNFAYSYLPLPSKKRVALVSSGNAYLETLLEIDPQVELVRVSPERYVAGTVADVTIFDRNAPDEPPKQPYLLIRPPPNTAWLQHEEEEILQPEVRDWSRDHRVLETVALEDLVVDRASRARAADAERLVESSEEALILAGVEPTRWLLLTFALEDSNLPLLPGFPIFLANALGWLSGESTVVAHPVGVVELPMLGVRVSTLEGTPVPSYELGGRSYFESGEPGLFLAVNDRERLHIALNVNMDKAVDPNDGGFSEEDRSSRRVVQTEVGGRFAWTEIWIGLLLLAVGLLMLEWWSYHRRWTI